MTALEQIDLNSIQDVDAARRAIVLLFNLVEDLQVTIRELQAENQRLRDENNRLKGEQGKPNIKANRPPQPPAASDHSSEAERHQPQAWRKGPKRDRIIITREAILPVDRASLPADAEFKGHEDVVVQDVRFETDNILFHKEKYYSPSAGKTYLAALPPGYRGQFGPGLKALALVEYYACNVAEPKLLELFRNVGVVISAGELSNLLIKHQTVFHAEKTAVYAAGLRSSPWQHYDQTSTRVDGVNQQCNIVCNPLYTAFFTDGEQRSPERPGCAAQSGQPDLLLQCGSVRVVTRLGRGATGARPGAGLPAGADPQRGRVDWPCWISRRRRWDRSSASMSSKRPPWPPITPNWSSR